MTLINADTSRPATHVGQDGRPLALPFRCFCGKDACYFELGMWVCSPHMQELHKRHDG